MIHEAIPDGLEKKLRLNFLKILKSAAKKANLLGRGSGIVSGAVEIAQTFIERFAALMNAAAKFRAGSRAVCVVKLS